MNKQPDYVKLLILQVGDAILLYVCVSSPLVVVGQPRLIDITLSDAPANERGYLIATTVNTLGIAYTGPVCGEVDLLTAWITCINLGWLFTTGMSTTREFG